MLLAMEQQLEIAGMSFPTVLEVVLDSSRNTPTDSLTVKLPRYKNFKKEQIKVGAPVRWSAGYRQSGIFPEFEGRVFKIQPREPIEFECRDDMASLAGRRMQSNFYNAPLADVLGRAAAGMAAEIRVESPVPITLRCLGKSARFVLWELRRVYGYDCYFKNNRLVVEESGRPSAEAALRFVIPANDPKLRSNSYSGAALILEEQLELTSKPRNLRVVVESEDPKTGAKQIATYGSGTEEVRYIADGLAGSALQNRARALYGNAQGSFSGSFKTLGAPPVEHSMTIQIQDENEPERSGMATVERVVKTFSGESATYRQEIHVTRAVA